MTKNEDLPRCLFGVVATQVFSETGASAGVLASGTGWELTLPYVKTNSGFLRVCERPSVQSLESGELEFSLHGLDRDDAEYWIRVLLAMPVRLQRSFFGPLTLGARRAWHAVEQASAGLGPSFLVARSFFYSEIARLRGMEPERQRRRSETIRRRHALVAGFRLLERAWGGVRHG